MGFQHLFVLRIIIGQKHPKRQYYLLVDCINGFRCREKKPIFHFPKIKSVELFIIKIYFQLLWKYHLHLHTCKWIRIPIVMSILCCCMKDIWQDLFVFTSDYTHGTQGDREVWIVFHHAYSCPYIQEGIPTLVESL